MRIAVFDTDASEQPLIVQVLEKSGFECNLYSDADALAEAAHTRRFDAMVVDWKMGMAAGTSASAAVLRAMWREMRRERQPEGGLDARVDAVRVPVLLMVGGGGEDDIIEGLSAGADDYLIKPLRPSELIARLQALLRRAYPNETLERYEFAPYSFDPDACEVAFALDADDGKSEDGAEDCAADRATGRGSRRVTLTQKEFDLGLLLFRNAGRPLSRNHIREVVWGGDADVSSRTMDTHVSRLRSKLELGAASRYRIMPVYGYGYRLDRVEG